jgi:antitoxin PrlF
MMTPQPIRWALSEEDTNSLWQSSHDVESFLQTLREKGAGQAESVRAIRNAANVSLAEAKEIVHFSQTWSDMRASRRDGSIEYFSGFLAGKSDKIATLEEIEEAIEQGWAGLV